MFGPTPSWTSVDAEKLSNFLSSPSGDSFIRRALIYAPALDLTSSESAALSGARRAGYEEFLYFLQQSASAIRDIEPEREISERYPDLEDDAKWKEIP